VNHPYRAVVFDFDLTLADTRYGIVECVNFSLGRMGLATHTAERIIASIGVSHQERYKLLAPPDQGLRFQEYASLYQRRSEDIMPHMTTFYPPAPGVVRLLKDKGLRLAIVSSAYRSRIELTLDKAGLRPDFEVIMGYEDVSAAKPDPSGLLEAIRRLDMPAQQCVYVGDHVVDGEAAQRGGVPFVGVLSGTTQLEALEGFPHIAILDDLSGLPEALGLAGFAE